MWTERKNKSSVDINGSYRAKMVDPDLLAQQLLHTVQPRNGSSGATQPSSSRSSGIIPGAIAAGLFIAFILVLYTVLWRCMVSPPQRKNSKVRVRVQQSTSV